MDVLAVSSKTEYHRLWRQKNRDKVLAAKKRYALNNPEKIKEQNHKYRENNLEKCRAKETKYRFENREKRRETNRKYCEKNREVIREKNRAYSREYWKRYREKYPEKYRAHYLLNNAIQQGKIIPLLCVCGAPGEAHHEDYTKPLEVTWLCKKHHAEAHRKYK